jgi:dienelactone hydrolase
MRLLSAIALLLATTTAFADGPTPTEMFIRGKEGKLQAYLWRPAGKGPFPALVYNHGSEKDPIAGTESDIGAYFVSNGYVVLFPVRRGAGKSEGTYWRDQVQKRPQAERQQAAIAALASENDDVVAAIEWLRSQPFVDGKSISVAGCSFGGIHTLLTAARPLGLRAAVDFAGASMSWTDSPLLRERLLLTVEQAKIPVFFIQAQNDFNTAPSVVLSEAMRQKHLPAQMKIFPPHGSTPMAGHAHFCMHGTAEWGPAVLEFLRNPK